MDSAGHRGLASRRGLYIHIPFCGSRCVYCAFYSTTRSGDRQRYVDALCREMALRTSGEHVDTVYLGGGTPSQLTPAMLEQLFMHVYEHYDVSPLAEVTIECNPDDVSPSLCSALAGLPVNRVSMGAQTFDDARLHWLGRRHCAAQVTTAVDRLRQAGIDNVSIDLMYGFPGETIGQWQTDIEAALALGVEHLSAYALTIEPGTPLAEMVAEGRVEEPDEERQRAMYYYLKDSLQTAGYEHYELSNFCLPGRRSRHNSSYWNHTPYIGIGAAAHSFDRWRRQWNVADIDAYMKGVEEGVPQVEGEDLDDDTLYNETVMTALRTSDGLSLPSQQAHYRSYCLQQAEKYLECGWLRLDGDRLLLTRDGLFVSDMVMSDLMV